MSSNDRNYQKGDAGPFSNLVNQRTIEVPRFHEYDSRLTDHVFRSFSQEMPVTIKHVTCEHLSLDAEGALVCVCDSLRCPESVMSNDYEDGITFLYVETDHRDLLRTSRISTRNVCYQHEIGSRFSGDSPPSFGMNPRATTFEGFIAHCSATELRYDSDSDHESYDGRTTCFWLSSSEERADLESGQYFSDLNLFARNTTHDSLAINTFDENLDMRCASGASNDLLFRPETGVSSVLADGTVFSDESESRGIVSGPMESVLNTARMVAGTNKTVLLLGETGSGKDYLARYIHDHSPRSKGPFYSINCAAIPSDIAESELFGHESGAYSGANGRKRGLVELAEGGTILLNEIGELSLAMQCKLLTFLDTFCFTRVGGEKNVTVNVRIIAATNRDIEKELSQGGFRKDLYYRLNGMSITVPPLRQRLNEIQRLSNEIITDFSRELGLPGIPELSSNAVKALSSHSWPGNIRELKNVLERAVILSGGRKIRAGRLNLGGKESEDFSEEQSFSKIKSLQEAIEETERSYILEALKQAKGKKQGTAEILGISRFALSRYMARLGISCETENS